MQKNPTQKHGERARVSERLRPVEDSNPEPLLTWMYLLSPSNTYKRVHLAAQLCGFIIKYN